MTPERWAQVDSLLQSVLAHPPGERGAFLRQACAGDPALEAEVRSLLASQQAAGSFLESPAIEVAAQALAHRQHEDALARGDSLTGQTISHYRLIEQVGVGGMGVVWKAQDTRLNRFVALKFLPAACMSDPERRRRFIQEARAASALNHPNIVTVFDIGQAGPEGDPSDFIAMEFVSGQTLGQLIPRKRLSLNEALQYAIQMAGALAVAHAAGIVHRDLKPGNVMVNESGTVKVLDFGLAKLTGAGEFAPAGAAAVTKTAKGTIVGTVAYMSPEQAEGNRVDARSDIFSFGAVLYEMLTGRRAFVGDSTASILAAILRDQPKPAGEIARGIPRGLDRIVRRCLEKDPSRRYQHAGDLKLDLEQVQEEPGRDGVVIPRPGLVHWRWLAAAAVCVAVWFALEWRFHRPGAALPPRKLTRLTYDIGLSNHPALSADGKLLAYSSDSGVGGERDLYIKQVAGGQPIRLTSDGAGNATPDFSPDGSRIVFRSNRDGGGIYVIPAFGGEARLVARNGLNPKFSPDGSHIAYWSGVPSAATTVPGAGTVWVIPVPGGEPRRVALNFTAARNPIWSPDGKHLLLIGYTSAKAFESSSIDWWMVAIDGIRPVRTGAYGALVHAGLETSSAARMPVAGIPIPECWSGANQTVIFSAANGSTQNLWEIGISPLTGEVSGAPRRVTTGAGNELEPSCAADGTVAFTNGENRGGVWSLPFDLEDGAPKGALERVTQGPAWREYPSLSSDGRNLAFVSNQSGQFNIWTRDLATGKELIVDGSSLVQGYPVISPSGAKVAYSVYEGDKRLVYVSEPGEAPHKLCEGCLQVTSWSRDEKTVLMFSGSPYQINILDVASRRQTLLLKHPTHSLLFGRFSPDNRWVSFTARIPPDRGRIAIAPVDGPKPVPESAWITIAEERGGDWATWSPDGRTLYFTSDRDGHNCLWGQRIDRSSHRPVGEAFAVEHLHGHVFYGERGWSVAHGRIALALVETSGNIWMMSPSGPR